MNADGTFCGVVLYHLSSRRFERLTQSGSIPRWLSEGRRLLYHDRGRIYLSDSHSKRIREMVSAAPNQIERRFAVSTDGRIICFVVSTTQSDIWMATLE